MQRTYATTVESKIVVRGGRRLGSAWPEEVPTAVPVRRAAEIGDPEAVVALLAKVEGVDESDYLVAHGGDTRSLRALTAHCEAAILQAALRIRGELTPAAVVTVLHHDLATHPDRRRELADLLAS